MKKLFALLLMLSLLLSLAACGGSAREIQPQAGTPAAPAASGPVGQWSLSECGNPANAPGQVTLVLDENGGGYQAVTQFKDDFVYRDYSELRWSEDAIVIDGVGGVYLLQGDSLTFTWQSWTDVYVRTGGAPAPLTPPAGIYTSFVVYEEGEEYPDNSFSITIEEDGRGSWFGHGEELPMTWNRYFLTLDGDQSFYYVWDGSQLTVYDGEYQIILAPTGSPTETVAEPDGDLFAQYLAAHPEYTYGLWIDINQDGVDELILSDSPLDNGGVILLCALSSDGERLLTWHISSRFNFNYDADAGALVTHSSGTGMFEYCVSTLDGDTLHVYHIGHQDEPSMGIKFYYDFTEEYPGTEDLTLEYDFGFRYIKSSEAGDSRTVDMDALAGHAVSYEDFEAQYNYLSSLERIEVSPLA